MGYYRPKIVFFGKSQFRVYSVGASDSMSRILFPSLSSTASCWFFFGVLYNIMAHGLEAGLYPKAMKSPTLDEYSDEIIDGK